MFKKVFINKYLVFIPTLILMGFFACMLHIGPEVHHQADSHAQHDTKQAACVDHQVSASLSHKDHGDSIQVAILPETSIQSALVSNVDFTYSSWTKLHSPPTKTAIYIKNNTFLI